VSALRRRRPREGPHGGLRLRRGDHRLGVRWEFAALRAAEKGYLYFGGLGVGTDVLRLLAGRGVIVALLLLPVSRKLERERSGVDPGAFSPPAQQLAGEL
jgi:hypothetical protein